MGSFAVVLFWATISLGRPGRPFGRPFGRPSAARRPRAARTDPPRPSKAIARFRLAVAGRRPNLTRSCGPSGTRTSRLGDLTAIRNLLRGGLGDRLASAVLHRPRRGRSLSAGQRARPQRCPRHASPGRAARGGGRVPGRHLGLQIPDEVASGVPPRDLLLIASQKGRRRTPRLRRPQGHARPASPGGARASDQAAGLRRSDLPPGRREGPAHGRGDQGGRLPGGGVRVEPQARRQPDHQAAGQEGIDRRRRLRQPAVPDDHQHRGAAGVRAARADRSGWCRSTT